MAVRVKLKVKVGGKTLDVVALVNSGFETEDPQLLVPEKALIANAVDVANLPRGTIVEYGTAGGEISMYVVKRACRVSVTEPDRESREVEADLVISPIEREVLISDALAEELGIILLSLKRGLWRLADDPPDKARATYAPQYW